MTHDSAAWQPSLLISFVSIFTFLLCTTCFTCAVHFSFVSLQCMDYTCSPCLFLMFLFLYLVYN